MEVQDPLHDSCCKGTEAFFIRLDIMLCRKAPGNNSKPRTSVRRACLMLDDPCYRRRIEGAMMGADTQNIGMFRSSWKP